MEQQGPDLPSHLKQLKRTDEIYYTVVCQDTTSDSEGSDCSERTSKEVSPMTAPGHSQKSSQEAIPVGARWSLGGLLWWGRQCWKSRKAKMMRVQRAEYQSGETHKERTLQGCAENACKSLAEKPSALICEEITRVLGRSHPIRIKTATPELTQGR